MLDGKKIVVVLPAYRAARTLTQTYREIPRELVDDVLLVDDASDDATVATARELGIRTVVHPENRGYGGNQKTCYTEALRLGADMAAMVGSGIYDLVLGSRILGNTAMSGGMPLYKYVSNRLLTAFENAMLGSKLSEFHTGYRAYSRRALLTMPLRANSDDFVFDNQVLAQAVAFGLPVGEVSCPTKYFPEASSIGFGRSVRYGLGVVATSVQFRAWKWGLARPRIFSTRPEDRLTAAAAGEPA
jgi:glycosyltransferase involved in cell wall biosynthesis